MTDDDIPGDEDTAEDDQHHQQTSADSPDLPLSGDNPPGLPFHQLLLLPEVSLRVPAPAEEEGGASGGPGLVPWVWQHLGETLAAAGHWPGHWECVQRQGSAQGRVPWGGCGQWACPGGQDSHFLGSRRIQSSGTQLCPELQSRALLGSNTGGETATRVCPVLVPSEARGTHRTRSSLSVPGQHLAGVRQTAGRKVAENEPVLADKVPRAAPGCPLRQAEGKPGTGDPTYGEVPGGGSQ